MSNMRYTSEELRQITDRIWRRVMGALRRVAVELTDGGAWRVGGYEKLKEKFRAEVYSGVGFYARPLASAAVDAIVNFVGNAEHGAIVATRDEGLRQKHMGDAPEDTTGMYNSQVGVFCDDDGVVRIRQPNGSTTRLPTMADFNALRTYVINQFSTASGHTHVVSGGATTTTTTVNAPGTAPTFSPAAAVGTPLLETE